MQLRFMRGWTGRVRRLGSMALIMIVLAACGATTAPSVTTSTTNSTGGTTTRVTRGRVATTVSASGTVAPSGSNTELPLKRDGDHRAGLRGAACEGGGCPWHG